jgi:hypothetical protein
VASLEEIDVADVASAGGGYLPVRDPSLRGDRHAGAGDLGTPAEVDVLPEQRHGRVEAVERCENVSPDEGATPRGREDISRLVVLGLIEFAGVHTRLRRPETMHPEADVE